MEEKGLEQVSDSGAIEALCDQAIAASPKAVAEFKAGKAAAINSIKGQVMKLSQGKANPQMVGDILARKLQSVAAVCHSERSRGTPLCKRWITRRDPSTLLRLRSG